MAPDVTLASILLVHLHNYADDIVLIAPTPSSMRRLLSICDVYAAEYNISFIATKS